MAKLSTAEQMEGTEAVKDFRNDCMDDYRIFTQIIVSDYEDNELFEFDEMQVIVTLGSNYHIVDVMWEEQMKNYQKQKLYGRYRTDYVKMEYSYKELTILSDERKIVIQG